MSLLDHALCTLAEVKDALDITDSSKDDYLTRQINAATVAIENYCGIRFKQTTYTHELYDGSGTNYINLRNYPVLGLTALARNTGTSGDPDWDDVQTDFYKLVDNGSSGPGQIYYSSGFSRGSRNFRVSYVAGYASIPDDVKEACIALVSYRYGNRRNMGMKSERLGEYQYERFGNANSSLKQNIFELVGIDFILDNYRTPNV